MKKGAVILATVGVLYQFGLAPALNRAEHRRETVANWEADNLSFSTRGLLAKELVIHEDEFSQEDAEVFADFMSRDQRMTLEEKQAGFNRVTIVSNDVKATREIR
jgi:hypothetical protein